MERNIKTPLWYSGIFDVFQTFSMTLNRNDCNAFLHVFLRSERRTADKQYGIVMNSEQ